MSSKQYPLLPEVLQIKICPGCKVQKTVDDFHVNKIRKDKVCFLCKDCACEITRKWGAENPERALENAYRWARENPEKSRKIHKRYYLKNRDRLLENSRNRYYELIDHYTALGKAWRAANPEKVRARGERRRARKAAVPSGPKPTLDELIDMQDGTCVYCRTVDPPIWHMDHVIPISKGGPDTADNVVAACASCNTSKQDRDVDEWMRFKGYLN